MVFDFVGDVWDDLYGVVEVFFVVFVCDYL